MAKLPYPIDLDASDAIRLAPSDPDEAAKALLIAASYIRGNKSIPLNVGNYIADAIEYSMLKDREHRNSAFLRELNLEAENRRPSKAHWIDVGPAIDELLDNEQVSLNAAATVIAKQHSISKKTALRRHKEWISAQEEVRRINREESESDQHN